MHIESQCCTKDQAQTLYELGVFGETLFYHTSWGILPKSSVDFKNGHVLNALLAGELGQILSAVRYKAYGFPLIFTSSYNDDGSADMFGVWSCGCRNPVDFSNPDVKSETEAQARAELLIFLLRNKIVTAEHCNNALKQK
jgi:hypothetical protein